jgi:hypothetical protein
VTLQPVTRRIAQAVLGGGPITRKFQTGSLPDKIPQAMGFAIRALDSGAAALPAVRLVVRRADGQIIGDLGTHGRPTVRAASRSGTPSPRRRGARASAPLPWPPWPGAWRRCRGSVS